MARNKVIIGNKYNNLLVLKEMPHKLGNGIHKRYLCQCDCGNYTEVQSNHLLGGTIKSCGCLVKGKPTTENTELYLIYKGIKKRCFNKNATNYKYYGAKGIKICDEWLDYKNFKKWAIDNGYKYIPNSTRSERLSIDRIDSNKDYEPSNCRWIPFKENLERSKIRN